MSQKLKTGLLVLQYVFPPEVLIPLFLEFFLQSKITKCGYPLALAFSVMTKDNDPRIIFLQTSVETKTWLENCRHVFKQKTGSNSAILCT